MLKNVLSFFTCFSVKCLHFQQTGGKRDDHLKAFHKLCFFKKYTYYQP